MTSFHSGMKDLDLSLKLFKPFLDFINPDLDELRKVESMSGISYARYYWYMVSII